MTRTLRILFFGSLLVGSVAFAACSDSSDLVGPDEAAADTISTSARWNQRAVALVVARQPAGNGQAAVSRILTYLSVAQYRAAVAALAITTGTKPSVTAAIGGASVAVLNSFFPLDTSATSAQLRSDLAALTPANGNVAAGESLGRSVAATLVASIATDNYLVDVPGAAPVGADKWVSSASPVVRSLYGTRSFFLTSPSQLRAPAPPAMGSPQFVAGLAEVRRIADARTATETAIAIRWNTSSGTFTAGALNLIADSLIVAHKIGEAESARILAFANAASFDAQIACWDSKFAYWYPRPSQADKAITLAIPLPNHPSYPSGHSCMTAAFMGVVSAALPQQKAVLDAMVEEAGMSRVYGGIHFRFDCEAGREIGRAAAELALKSSLK